jgi:hypothetical protein
MSCRQAKFSSNTCIDSVQHLSKAFKSTFAGSQNLPDHTYPEDVFPWEHAPEWQPVLKHLASSSELTLCNYRAIAIEQLLQLQRTQGDKASTSLALVQVCLPAPLLDQFFVHLHDRFEHLLLIFGEWGVTLDIY